MNTMTLCRRCLTAAILLGSLAGCGGGGPQTLATLAFEDATGMLELGPEAVLEQGPDGGVLAIGNRGERLLVNLCETQGPRGDVETIAVDLRARSELLKYDIYLDLWIFPRDGEPRLARTALPGIRRTVPWTDVEVRVPLKPGERPGRLRIAIYAAGPGRIWLDDLVVRAGRSADLAGGR
ncbi:MAG: hypothetical protein Q7W56_05205 [Candidatus Latescibacteria bacterium]|nr:hypothetical protein [Candidatus Latescibacterota bacterium]